MTSSLTYSEDRLQELSEQISGLFTEVVDKAKKNKPEHPDLVKMANRAAIHAHIDTFPESLFKTKAPREDDNQWKYRQANYRSNTRVHWNKAVNSTNRIYNKQNYDIIYKDDKAAYSSESAKDYFTTDYPKFGNLMNWFQSVFHCEKFVDANAVAVVMPKYIPEATELVSPIAKIYPNKDIYHYSNEMVLILSDERSLVTYGGTSKKEGMVFYLFTSDWIYKIIQVGKKVDYKFEIEEYYEHGLGEVPAMFLKGYPIKDYYKSYFYDALDALDEALYDYSTLQLGKVDRVFPIKNEIVDKCHNSECEGGYIPDGIETDSEGNTRKKFSTCPSCSGSGLAGKSGPLVVNAISSDRYNDPDLQTPPFPNVAFVSPDVEPLRFLKEDIDNNLTNAFVSLNLPVTIDKLSGKETATGRLIDREEFYSFLVHLSQENFEQLDTLMWWIGGMRYGSDYQGHIIIPPHDFAIRSAAELTTEINDAVNMPDVVKDELTKQYVSTRLNSDPDAVRIGEIISTVDSLRYKGKDEIGLAVASGAVEKWRWNLHLNVYAWILQRFAEDKDYIYKDVDEIRTDLEVLAKASARITPETIISES